MVQVESGARAAHSLGNGRPVVNGAVVELNSQGGTQAAIEAGTTGLQPALTHARAAEQERPSPQLKEAIKDLKGAVQQGKSGKPDVATKAAQAALQTLQA